MKKNFQFIVVIFFVTLAFLIMLNDVKNYKNDDHQTLVNATQTTNQVDIATTDVNEVD